MNEGRRQMHYFCIGPSLETLYIIVFASQLTKCSITNSLLAIIEVLILDDMRFVVSLEMFS